MLAKIAILLFSACIAAIVGSPAAHAARIVAIHEQGSDAAILLVHGLEGSAATSFENQESGESWPDLVLADTRPLLRNRTLSSFDIYAVDYSDVFVGSDDVNVSVEEMARQVATALEAHSLLRDHNHVWIIAHSLGGIIVKRILIKWGNARYERYIQRIAGISLLGVPSNGAPLGDIGSTRFGRLIGAWLGYNARHVSDLRTIGNMNTFLRAVENDWATFVFNRRHGIPHISCAYETVAQYSVGVIPGIGGSVTIVPEIYTKTGCDGEPEPINKNHISLPKPSGPDDEIETWLFTSVRKGFVRLDSVGQEFAEAERIGSLWRLIDHIRKGHQRIDGYTGIPIYDESITVSASDASKLMAMRLARVRHAGATWADVLERVAEANSCVSVSVRGKTRRDIAVSLVNPVVCADAEGATGSYACAASDCPR